MKNKTSKTIKVLNFFSFIYINNNFELFRTFFLEQKYKTAI
jgi:hypothetical protein